MSEYSVKLVKTVTYTAEVELGEQSDADVADAVATKLADDLNDSPPKAPDPSWDLEDEQVEAEEIWEN